MKLLSLFNVISLQPYTFFTTSTRRTGYGQVGFVVNRVALGQVFSEYFVFPCQSSFHQILHLHNQLGQVQ
jgi:hypothetical protein